jgi:phenylacetate-CoA ligase
MLDYLDRLETRAPKSRDLALTRDLKAIVSLAKSRAPGLRRLMRQAKLNDIKTRDDLARMPILRGAEIAQLISQEQPYGGFNTSRAGHLRHVLPGAIAGQGKDWWGVARALHAAGIRRGELIHNAFSYHLASAGHMIESGAQALRCGIVPAGSAPVERHLEVIEKLRPTVFCGKAAFLDLLLQKAAELRCDISSITKAFVFGAPLSSHLRAGIEARGIKLRQAYVTSLLGVIAYETDDADGQLNDGMILNEGVILELVKPGTDLLVANGDVGEMVVTRLNVDGPLLRCSTGDLTQIMQDPSPCGRTNLRIKGWLGRADQAVLLNGQLVSPAQVIDLASRHKAVRHLRLVLKRERKRDAILLRAESDKADGLAQELSASLKALTGLEAQVEFVPAGSLSDDAMLIVDERAGS